MRFSIWGSCSGTEPLPGRHHTSWTLEHHDEITWFDAGENCSYAAYLAERDLLRTRRIFISHCHLDHVGGLLNLFGVLRKLVWMHPNTPRFTVDVYLPVMQLFDGLMTTFQCTEIGEDIGYDIRPHLIQQGMVYDTPELTVRCVPNLHLNNRQPSYSYAIRADRTNVVWTGDVRSWHEVESFLQEGCDLMMMETGHHDPATVSKELKDSGYRIDNLLFVHHGVQILRDPQGELAKIRAAFGPHSQIANEGMAFSEKDLKDHKL